MMFLQNQKSYTLLLKAPSGRPLTLTPGAVVEGSFFASQVTLTPIDALPEGKTLVFSQTAWQSSKTPIQAVIPIPDEDPATPVAEPEVGQVPNITELRNMSKASLQDLAARVGAPVALDAKRSDLFNALRTFYGLDKGNE